jgi:protein FAM50
MHRGFGREGDTGVHTVEGTKAGSRAAGLTQQRAADQEAYEAKKRKLEEDSARGVGRIDDKFDSTVLNTVLSGGGLQTKAQYVAAQAAAAAPAPAPPAAAAAAPKRRKKASKRPKAVALSFADDDCGDGGEVAAPKALKCPDVETSFLPDRARDDAARGEAAALAAEWTALQERAKAEPLEVVYSAARRGDRGAFFRGPSRRGSSGGRARASPRRELPRREVPRRAAPRRLGTRAPTRRRRAGYWDGSGHRRTLEITKGHTIGKFLAASLAQLEHEFPDLRRVHVDNLMYVKEDLVIPHYFTFHDLIVSRARGKSGPLFRFDAKDDVRLGPTDVRVESDATHPGKVVMRAWFERNKHIFPASRWEPYDPAVARDDRYTVKGD